VQSVRISFCELRIFMRTTT